MALGYGLAMSIFRQRTLIKGFLLGCIPVLAALALAGGEPRGAHVGRGANSSILVIETATAWHEFSVEIARSPVDQARGLMFRRRLRTDSGMLFIYSRDQQITMWMKNTVIPLDMLFIARDGRIVNIAERAIPMSLRSIPSSGPVRAVLEVNGGTASRLKIFAGDKVVHPAFRRSDPS